VCEIMSTKPLSARQVGAFVSSVFENDLHAKRVASLAGAALGVIRAGSLCIHAIGHGLAKAESLNSKHAIKQVDRMLSNEAIVMADVFTQWVPFVVGGRTEIVVALDWTEFDADNQSTIAVHLLTSHGRATPLMWMTFEKSKMRDRRNKYEDRILTHLRDCLPEGVKVTILADRGFGDQKLYRLLMEELKFHFIIRFKGGIAVKSSVGEVRKAAEWVPANGRATLLRDVRVTKDEFPLPAVVCVKAAGMKEPWCLAVSDPAAKAADAVKLYGRRFTIEESFRDTKDIRFGMGLAATHIGDPDRRDRLLLISALAGALLTLLGAAGESLGMDRMLKANTSKKRSHSLFTQGTHYYGAIPTMRDDLLAPLTIAFVDLVKQHAVFQKIFGPI